MHACVCLENQGATVPTCHPLPQLYNSPDFSRGSIGGSVYCDWIHRAYNTIVEGTYMPCPIWLHRLTFVTELLGYLIAVVLPLLWNLLS